MRFALPAPTPTQVELWDERGTQRTVLAKSEEPGRQRRMGAVPGWLVSVLLNLVRSRGIPAILDAHKRSCTRFGMWVIAGYERTANGSNWPHSVQNKKRNERPRRLPVANPEARRYAATTFDLCFLIQPIPPKPARLRHRSTRP